MKILKSLPVFLLMWLFLIKATNSQGVGIGQWREHLPYQNVISIAELGDLIYAATPYSLFYYNRSDASISRLSKVNGLSDVNISVIASNPDQTTLIIAYSNANIDLLQQGNIISISDIKRKPIMGNKTINNITFIGEYAYLSCGFGIVKLDIKRHEIVDTYYIGSSGTSINIYDIAYYSPDSSIYATTESGILYADINSPNLAHFIYWHSANIPGSYSAPFNHIISFQNKLIANKPGNNQNNDTLFVFDGSSWKHFDNSHTRSVKRLKTSNNKLLVTRYNEVFIYDQSFAELVRISDYKSGTVNSRDAIIASDGKAYIADMGSGLMRQADNDFRFESIRPNGPATHEVFAMQAAKLNVYMVPGARTSWWDNTWKSPSLSIFKGQSWTTRHPYNTSGMENFNDLLSIAVDPLDHNHLFVGSWGKGMFEMLDEQIVARYNETNSSLKFHTLRNDWIGVGGIAFDNQGNVWVTNNHSTDLLSVRKADGTWRSFNLSPVASAIELGDIVIDHSNQKWMLLRQHGLLVFNDNGTIDNIADDQKRMLTGVAGNGNIPGSIIQSIAVDLNGELWIGTNEGVAVIRNPENVFTGINFDAYQPLINQDGYWANLLVTEAITAIAVDGANRKWFGTDKSGVFLMSADGMEQIYNFNEDNSPLLSNSITSITIDENGEVYFGTTRGIISFRSTATETVPILTDVVVFPNPVRPEYNGPIAIKGLTGRSDLKITDIAGNLVWKQDATNSAYQRDTGVFGGQTIWNGRTLNGQRARSGVYLVFISNNDGSETMVAKILFMH